MHTFEGHVRSERDIPGRVAPSVPAFPAGISNHALSRAILQRCHFDFGVGETKIPKTLFNARWQKRGNQGYYHFIDRSHGATDVFDKIAGRVDLSGLHLHLVAQQLIVTFARRDGPVGEQTVHFYFELQGNSFCALGRSNGVIGNEAPVQQLASFLACQFAVQCKSPTGKQLTFVGDIVDVDAILALAGVERQRKAKEKKPEADATPAHKRQREEDDESAHPATKKKREEPAATPAATPAAPALTKAIAYKILNTITEADLGLSGFQLQLVGWKKLKPGGRAAFLRSGNYAGVIIAAIARIKDYKGPPAPTAAEIDRALT